MDLAELRFTVDTSQLEKADKAIASLATSIGKLNTAGDKSAAVAAKVEAAEAKKTKELTKAAVETAKLAQAQAKTAKAESEAAVAAEKTAQATARTTKATTEAEAAALRLEKAKKGETAATKESVSIQQRQADILDFMQQGYTRGQSSILAYAKAAGEATTEIAKILDLQRQLIGGDPFDKSLSGLKALKNELTTMTEVQRLYNEGSSLTAKQVRELARDEERLLQVMKAKGATQNEIDAATASLKNEYTQIAGKINTVAEAERALLKARKDAAAGSKYIADTDARLAAALDTTNNSLDRRATDTMVKYRAALVATGASSDQVAVKMQDLKGKLDAVASKERAQQLEYLSRAISVQMGDVAVSLASGMNPLMVMIQQGDQIRGALAQAKAEGKDLTDAMYGGAKKMAQGYVDTAYAITTFFGGALKYAGTTIADFITAPVKLATAAIKDLVKGTDTLAPAFERAKTAAISFGKLGIMAVVTAMTALGVEYYKIMKSETDLSKAVTLTGGAMGLSKDEAIKYAQAYADIAGTTLKASQVIAEMAKAGNISKDQIGMVMSAAINLEKYGGVAISETVKQFSKLGEKPVEALMEVAKANGAVDASIVAQVKQLAEQKNYAEASRLAMLAYGAASLTTANILKENLSPLERVLVRIKEDIDKAAQAMYGFTNSSSFVDALRVTWALLSTQVILFTKGLWTLVQTAGKAGKILKSLVLWDKEGVLKAAEEARAGFRELADDLQNVWDFSGQEKSAHQSRLKAAQDFANQNLKNYQDLLALQGKWNEDKKKKEPKSASGTLQVPRSNELSEIKKRFDGELRLAKEYNQAERDILKARFDAGLVERGEYIVKDNALLRQSEEKQLQIADDYQEEYGQKYVKRYMDLIAARDKALSANKGLKDEQKQNDKIIQDFSTQIENMGNEAQTTYEQLDNLRKSIANAVTSRETKNILEFDKAIKDLNKSYLDFTNANKDANNERKIEAQLQDSLVGVSEATATRLKAEYETMKKFVPEIRKFNDELIRAQIALANVTSPESTATDAEVQAAVNYYVEASKKARQVVADAGVEVEKAGIDAVVNYYKIEYKKISDGISSAITDALFEGGKGGAKKIKDILIAELKKPINVMVKAFVNPIVNQVGQMFGFGSEVSAGASAASAGGSAATSTGLGAIGSTIGGMFGAGGIGGSLMAGAGWLTGATSLTGSLTAATSLMGTGSLAGLTSGLGMMAGALGPIALGVVAIMTLLGKGGGPKTGGSATASSTGGILTGADRLYTPSERDAEAQDLTKSVIKGIKDAVKGFGGTIGEFTVGLGFDLDPKGKAPNRISSFLSTAVGDAMRNINLDLGRESGDLQKGLSLEVQRLIIAALQTAELPKQISNIFKGVEAATATQEQVQNTLEAAKAMGNLLNVFKSLRMPLEDITTAMTEAAGGVEALTNSMKAYIDNFYTTEEKFKMGMTEMVKTLNSAGIKTIPSTNEQFRSLAESIDKSTESGQIQYGTLMAVSGQFAQLTSSMQGLLEERAMATATSAEDYQRKIAQGYAIPGFARGGSYQGGLALVGEQGPELIDFNQPGHIYTAGETSTVLSSGNTSMIYELQSLRQEVGLLRAEVRADVSHNAKTARLLERVTPDGDSLQVVTVTA